MLYLEKNPYVWDPASDDITSPVMDISLKDKQNSPVVVNNMSEPVTVSLSSPGRSTDRFCQNSPVVVNNMSEPVTVSLSSPGRSTDRFCQNSPVVVNNMSEPVTVSLSSQVGVLIGFARTPQ